MQRLNILIIFGGKSSEHKISISSAKNVIQGLDLNRFNPILVGISQDTGTWYHLAGNKINQNIKCITDSMQNKEQIVNLIKTIQNVKLCNSTLSVNLSADFVLPILHGKNGEDGSLQGLCQILNLPIAGCGVTSSAACMDKDFTKSILANAGIPVIPHITLFSSNDYSYEEIVRTLGLPFFIKPANTGSSIGVYKIKNKHSYEKCISKVFQYDCKIVVETYIAGREIECAILGNIKPLASVLGEIKTNYEFYSYAAKYLDPNGADLIIPAKLAPAITTKIQEYAKLAFKTIGCKGFSRIDFLVTETNDIFLNEINTIPGFTNISMYPKLFKESGIEYTNLISSIIDYGIEDFNRTSTYTTKHELDTPNSNYISGVINHDIENFDNSATHANQHKPD